MRRVAPLLVLLGCGPVFVANHPPSRDALLASATLVIVGVGVIEEQKLESWPFFRAQVPDDTNSDFWRVLRRRVRVETVLRGSVKLGPIDVYEVYWVGGTTGDWKATQDGERAMFPLRMEKGFYRVAGDWNRSIFPVSSGPHSRLPLDDSRPLWERIALMNLWFDGKNAKLRSPDFARNDPGGALSLWRTMKLLRGLLRHPRSGIRVAACRELLSMGGWGQDECWEQLSDEEQTNLRAGGYTCCTAQKIAKWRREKQDDGAARLWKLYYDRDEKRLLTTMNNSRLRREFCLLAVGTFGCDRRREKELTPDRRARSQFLRAASI